MLADVRDWGDEISLVPNSGTQFLDFAFDLDAHRRLSCSFIERAADTSADREFLNLLRVPDLDDDAPLPPLYDLRPTDMTLDVNANQALEIFLEKWVPVPFLRVQDGSDPRRAPAFDQGPTNWARVRVVELPDRLKGEGPSHRVVFAFDTAIEEQKPNRPYAAPSQLDVTSPTMFHLASDLEAIGWFFSDTRSAEEQATAPWFQGWVDDWLMECYAEYMQVRYPRQEFRAEEMECRLEHWMRYLTFLETLQKAVAPPTVKFIDTITLGEAQARTKTPPVGVDLVLDVGNSRTCGLLIESYPNERQMDLNNSLVLQLRDLTAPEHVYQDPFSSHVELAQPRFGRSDLSRRSSRSTAFFWPSAVRVGPEALRIRGQNDGTGSSTGMSSPKRYIWDVEPVETAWEFQPQDYPPDRRPPPIEVQMRQRMNAAGDVLEQLRAERRRVTGQALVPAPELTFSRSSFFTLLMAEIVMQAICMANSVSVRQGRPFKDSPRQINRIVMTVPPATTLQERQIMQSRVEGALRLIWSLMGWDKAEGDAARAVPKRPTIRMNLDEASCIHFVWLYGEIARKFGGASAEYARIFGHERPFAEPEVEAEPGTPPEPSLRVASIDVGGGTTDLMVTTYYLEDNRALKPTQNFREGFRIAGDDVLRGVIETMVFPAIEAALTERGARNARELLIRLFGGDRPEMPVQDKQLRRQFALRVLQPVGIAILAEHEAKGRFSEDEVEYQSIAKLLGEPAAARVAAGERAIPAHLLEYIEAPAAAMGVDGLIFEDIEVPLDFGLLASISQNTLGDIADQLAEVINLFDVDMVLLSGRPARLPVISDLFLERFPAGPEKVLSLGDYRTDTWYPFRTADNVRIRDPKTCAAVGGMLCVLAERQIQNFTLYTNRLSMRSTARFIGQMEIGGQIKNEGMLFSDIDLDQAKAGHDEEAELKYFAPMRVGFRQLPLERWTTTPLYRLEFVANDNFSTDSLPFNLTLRRATVDLDDEETDPEKVMSAQAGREEFKIVAAEDRHNKRRKPDVDFRLSLCTMPEESGYWLDTGIFNLS